MKEKPQIIYAVLVDSYIWGIHASRKSALIEEEKIRNLKLFILNPKDIRIHQFIIENLEENNHAMPSM